MHHSWCYFSCYFAQLIRHLLLMEMVRPLTDKESFVVSNRCGLSTFTTHKPQSVSSFKASGKDILSFALFADTL